MSRKRYHLANGFHNTTTSVLVAPLVGARVPGRVMRRAFRDLCGMSDCRCGSSHASEPREGQHEGFADDEYRHLAIDWAQDDDDRDAYVVRDTRTD